MRFFAMRSRGIQIQFHGPDDFESGSLETQ
jgi:hypothetical protein